MMNRRGFLGSLLAATAALTLDPEELLWTNKKTIFIPPAPLAFKKDAFVSIRFIRSFDPIHHESINRFDVLFGFGEVKQVGWRGDWQDSKGYAADLIARESGIPKQRFMDLPIMDAKYLT